MSYSFLKKDNKVLDRSVKSIILSVSLLIATIIIYELLLNSVQDIYVLLLALSFLGFLHWFVTPCNSPVVLIILCWFLTIFSSYHAWQNIGAMDPILFSYFGILLIAGVFSGRIVMLSLATYMVVSIYCLHYAESMQLKTFVDISYPVQSRSVEISIIMVIFYAIALDVLLSFLRHRTDAWMRKNQRLITQVLAANESKKINPSSGMPNSLACEEAFQRAIMYKGATPALVYLRIDNFDNIVAIQGEFVANEFITKLSRKLTNETPFEIFHVSDKDLIVLLNIDEGQELSGKLVLITRVLSQPVDISAGKINTAYSAGLAQFPFDGQDFNLLRKKAVIALNTEQSRQSIATFTMHMEEKLRNTTYISERLESALKDQHFELYYQPKVDLKTNQIIGVEALIRWFDNGNFIPPDVFIRIAESTGYINQIGEWTIRQACFDCQRWYRETGIRLPVAVNLSPVQFSSGELPKIVSTALIASASPSSQLELELTESMEFNKDHNIEQQITALTGLGVTFSIDDFGSGYSNLAYISRYNASTLKIDRAFVQDLSHNPNHLHIVKSIIQIAGAYNLKIVAEGIEDNATGELLRDLGADIGQGYFWSRPLPYQSLIEYIRASTKSVA